VAERIARGAGLDLDRLTAQQHALAAKARGIYLRWSAVGAAGLLLTNVWYAWLLPATKQVQPGECAFAIWLSLAALSLLTLRGWRLGRRGH
jgi:hypothetical protein